MNDTKGYILEIRHTLTERLMIRFLIYLIVSALFFGIAFAFVSIFFRDGYFIIVRTATSNGNFAKNVLSLLHRTFPTAVTLLILYVSSHTVLSPIVSAGVSAWRGFSLGCMCALLRNGLIRGLDNRTAVLFCFAATIIIIFLSSISNICSMCICRAYADRMPYIERELVAEYLRIFLVLSGVSFLLVGACAILI